MKTLFSLMLLLVSFNIFAQTDKIYDSLNAQVVSIKARTPVNSDNHAVINIIQALSDETLQSDAGELSEGTRVTYQKMLSDPTTTNWHLLYLYQAHSDNVIQPTPNPKFQQACIKLLFEEFIDTYDAAPAVILIYAGETLMTQNTAAAAEHFKKALVHYPKSIPLMVYRWQLISEGPEKKQLYAKLKKDHPNHWMVKLMVK